MVALSADRGELTVLGAGIEPVAPGTLRDGAVRDAGAVGAALGRLLATLRVRCRVLTLAIGGGSVLVKRFPVPPEAVATGSTPGGLRDAVAREAARHVPFHLESLEFDYEGPLPLAREAAGEGPAAVVFGAAPREVVLAHCRAAVAAGREATRIELEPYALHAAVGLADRLAGVDRDSGALAIVEIGASRSGVRVFGNARPDGPAIRDRAAALEARAGVPADLLASVPALGAGAPAVDGAPPGVESGVTPGPPGSQAPARWQGGPGDGTEAVHHRVAAAAREAFREAGLGQVDRLLLSGGGAVSPAVCGCLEEFTPGAPAVLDPLGGLDPAVCGPAYSVAAGLAYQTILDRSGPGRGLRS